MITLYHWPRSRSIIVHWLLEELGQPYRLELVDIVKGQQHGPAFLAINPMGKIPVIEHDGVIVTEAAAICTHLADAFPAAGLAPPIGDRARGLYLRWLFFGPGCLEPAVTDHAFPRAAEAPGTALGYGSYDLVMDVLAQAVVGDRWLLGDRFTAADVVIGSGLRWGMMIGQVPKRPEFTAYAQRLEERPALQRTNAQNAQLMADLAGP
jgi:glutathione S-transferase